MSRYLGFSAPVEAEALATVLLEDRFVSEVLEAEGRGSQAGCGL